MDGGECRLRMQRERCHIWCHFLRPCMWNCSFRGQWLRRHQHSRVELFTDRRFNRCWDDQFSWSPVWETVWQQFPKGGFMLFSSDVKPLRSFMSTWAFWASEPVSRGEYLFKSLPMPKTTASVNECNFECPPSAEREKKKSPAWGLMKMWRGPSVQDQSLRDSD